MDKFKTVEEFLNGIGESKKQQVLVTREYILEAAPQLEEHIKWNAPSYKEGSEDRMTFNLLNKEGLVKLVFHMGVSRKENKKSEPVLKDAPLIVWVSDIRGYITFQNLEHIKSQKSAIQDYVRRWLEIK